MASTALWTAFIVMLIRDEFDMLWLSFTQDICGTGVPRTSQRNIALSPAMTVRSIMDLTISGRSAQKTKAECRTMN